MINNSLYIVNDTPSLCALASLREIKSFDPHLPFSIRNPHSQIRNQ